MWFFFLPNSNHRVSSEAPREDTIKGIQEAPRSEKQEEEQTIVPSTFPIDKYTKPIKFVQDENFRARIEPADFRTLWDRHCIEVDNFPDPDLKNPIHAVFAREKFPHLKDAEYDYIRLATTLASRFIMEKNYLAFWVRLNAGKPRTRLIPGKTVDESYIGDIDRRRAMKTAAALEEIAQHITWFNIDEKWSQADPRRAGEAFMDADYQKCQRYKTFHKGVACGECSYCCVKNRGVCCICGYREYRNYNKSELKNVHRTRALNGFSKMSEKQLLAALEAEDKVFSPAASKKSTSIKVPNERFADIQIGLHQDMVKHVRDPERDTWTRCEQIRFQFGLAATLVHELAHPFWYFTQKRCWNCFNPDPWLSQTEPRHRDGPELGNSWEYWAFGMRTPMPGRICEVANESIPNVFQKHQWNYSISTIEAGESDVRHDLVRHNFILPFEWIQSWFQESTWQAIATQGRFAGRPSYTNAVILRGEATKFRKSSESLKKYQFGTRACTVELYGHAALAQNGGFWSKAGRNWMYGPRFETAKLADRYLRKLLADHNSRKKVLADRVQKEKQRQTRGGSTGKALRLGYRLKLHRNL